MPRSRVTDKPATTKRVKTAKADSGTRTRKKEGRLSILPTLPLDVLYEIFAHLDPGDLVSLARTTKSFRKVLLSRHATLIWRTALEATVEDGFPPRPHDMSEPAWAGFFFGGPHCSLCGGKTSLDVCWTIRKRFCKACAEAHLIPLSLLDTHPLKNEAIPWNKIIPTDDRRPLVKDDLSKTERNSKIPHAFDADVLEYEGFLQDDRDECDTDEKWEIRRAELDKHMGVRTTFQRNHALVCITFESRRAASRSAGREELREARWSEIAKRLLNLGFTLEDIDGREVQQLKEVKEPKLLTDKVWSRIEPEVVKAVTRERDNRLFRERSGRARTRQTALQQEIIGQVLCHVDHLVLPFVPPGTRIQKLFSASLALIEPDVPEVTESLRQAIRDALPAQISELQRVMNARGQVFRRAIPQSWAPAEALPHMEDVQTPELLNTTSFADLDRAVYVTRCKRFTVNDQERPLHFGLDVLAHWCDASYTSDTSVLPHPSFDVEIDQVGHENAVQLVGLLGLDAATATPLDLDRQDHAFVCVGCPRNSLGVIFSTWRDAIAHADPNRHEAHVTKRPVFRLANVAEERWLQSRLNLLPHRYHLSVHKAWGCGHCADHLARPISQTTYYYGMEAWRSSHGEWQDLAKVKEHIQQAHGINSAVEGQDVIYMRSAAAQRFVHLPYVRKRYRRRSGMGQDIVLPSVLDVDLNELSALNEAPPPADNNGLAAAQAQFGAEPDEDDSGSD